MAFWSCHKFYIYFLWFIFHATFICILSIPHFALTRFLALFAIFHSESSWAGVLSRCVHKQIRGSSPHFSAAVVCLLVLFFGKFIIAMCSCFIASPWLAFATFHMMDNDAHRPLGCLIPVFKGFLGCVVLHCAGVNRLNITDYTFWIWMRTGSFSCTCSLTITYTRKEWGGESVL